MVGGESQWSDHSNTPGLEKGNCVSQFHNNGYETNYTNSPHLQYSIGLKPEDIPIPSIEDASSHEPHRIVFVLPKLHTIRCTSDHHLDRAEAGNPNSPSVTNFPCVVFASVGAMNIGIGIGTLLLVCVSKKMRVVSNFSNAIFVIISAIGFGTAIGACNFLKQKSVLENDLWLVTHHGLCCCMELK
ncbi:hypothetical protein DL98DRAFT_537886 [Cadophora sp. DSE1049]|nr:hypothetical protein DL98DRAFT_537886 [Cadophora sp. DSE1049]